MEAVKKKENKKADRVPLLDKIKSSDQIQCYILLSLPIIGFLVFTIYPLVWSALKAFYFYDMIPNHTRFVGFDNFVTLFTKGGDYWRGWLVTLQFLLIKVPIEIPLALIIATILSKGLRGSNFFRNLYYLPCVISVAIVGIIFSNIFDVFGLANAWLTNLGVIDAPIDWFGGKWTAMFVLILGGIWSNLGTNVVYFTAALSNVPRELYEAADMEGAGTCTKGVSDDSAACNQRYTACRGIYHRHDKRRPGRKDLDGRSLCHQDVPARLCVRQQRRQCRLRLRSQHYFFDYLCGDRHFVYAFHAQGF